MPDDKQFRVVEGEAQPLNRGPVAVFPKNDAYAGDVAGLVRFFENEILWLAEMPADAQVKYAAVTETPDGIQTSGYNASPLDKAGFAAILMGQATRDIGV